MSRPLRVKYKGACYHVINRGNHQEVVFKEDGDCELFLEKLAEFAELYEVDIHTYCLMPNHFHLQLRTRLANLDRFMQSFMTSFTMKMNRKYCKSGHLFQGRYKAQLVESALYNNRLSRYIHLNPVKIKGFEDLPPKTIRKRLFDYKWSSYRCYLGLERKLKWLDRQFVLSHWGPNAAEKIANYRKYVLDGIKSDNADDIRALAGGLVIGSEEFKESIVGEYLRFDVSDIDTREQPDLAKLNASTIENVLKTVCEYYQITTIEDILKRRSPNREARKMAMFLAGRHCRRNEPLTSLATRFGVSISGFNMVGERLGRHMVGSPSIRKVMTAIEQMIKSSK